MSDGRALLSVRGEADAEVLAPIYETVRRVKAELKPANGVDRILRRALDGCDLHDRRSGHARSGAGADCLPIASRRLSSI